MGFFNNPCEILRTRRLLALGDFNSISAAKVDDGHGGLRYYDDEPYTEMDHDDLEFQVQASTIGTTQLADRRPTETLLRKGYMVDAAAHLGAPWEPTVGHWADGQGDPDPWGPRRIDLILASRSVAPALTGYRAHRSPAAEAASDHLPVFADFDPSKVEAQTGTSGPPITGRRANGVPTGICSSTTSRRSGTSPAPTPRPSAVTRS
ncbi:hypothetical protein ACFXPZ_38580 [Streptomyces sp. NPDC059101]|uniref:hypothetical protein n=1 Tax=Streptomyces sp. NPDC059101 TaxID=3346728 RepID=UPI0036A0A1F6